MTQRSYHQFLVSPEVGGAALVGLHVADHLQRCGQRSLVWLPGPGAAQRQAQRLGLPTAGYDAPRLMGRSNALTAWVNWQVAQRLRRDGAGLIHFHTPFHYAALRWGLRWAGVVRVLHLHLDTDCDALSWAARTPPDLIITCAGALEDRVRRALPRAVEEHQRIVAVPNAVDIDRFANGPKEPAKTKVGAPLESPLVLMLANLAPHKGQVTALRAVAILKQRGIRVACWLAGVERAGGTAFTAQLQRLIGELGIGDRVRLLGQRSDAPDLLRAADFFLLPSTSEGLPLSVLEAQACQVPVLAAPTAGVPEIVRDGQTGFLIDADNATGYADQMETLLVQREVASRVVVAARAHVEQHHSWSGYCRRMQELYDGLLEGRESPHRVQAAIRPHATRRAARTPA